MTMSGAMEEADYDPRYSYHPHALRDALFSMSPESRQYKGIAGSFDDIIQWLDQPLAEMEITRGGR